MKVTLESTTKVVRMSGIPCRVWEGVTEGGVKCFAFIPRIACEADADAAEFERDLHQQVAPSAAVQSFPLSMVM